MENLVEDVPKICLLWIEAYFHGFKQLKELIVTYYRKLADDLLTKSQHHTLLVLLFACVLCIVILMCWINHRKGKNKRKIAVSPKNESPLKLNWNVFDLAKTAYEPGHTEAVIRLVEKYNYDVNSVIQSSGLSLFLCSCLSGERKLIKYMISKGADVGIQTHDGDSALYLATFGILSSPYTDPDVLTELVHAGCGVNTQNNKGYTPLHRAAAKGNKEIINCLLKLGADIYLPTKAGIYPMDSAINAGHLDAAELLKIKLDNPHVWDVVDPHTPPRIKLGLQSPVRRHLIESTYPHRPFHKVVTY